jgi:predicted phage terminase large subunit-like protein
VPGKPVDEGDPDAWLFQPVETTVAAHHLLLLQVIERAAARRYGRFMVFMPPGSAKSTYASVVAPTYFMGRNPGTKIILASYGSDLARRHGRKARQIVRSPEYSSLFNATLSAESSAANEWALTNGSEYLAAGLTAGLTGNRAHGALIDDPIKGRAEANSETIRKSTWEAYVDDLQTRVVPSGWIGLVQTRWHEDDVAGRLLPKDYNGRSGMVLCSDGREWEVINLPAKCERSDDPLGRAVGEYLWPQWFDPEHWKPFESVPRTWAALFQQRPAPTEGDFFKPDQIKIIEALPATPITWVRGWDLASTVDGDWTVGLRLGRTESGQFIISDLQRLRTGPDERDAAIRNAAALDGRITKQSLPQDPGQAGKTQVLYLTRMLAGYKVVSSPETGDKMTRAEPVAAQINVGNVSMLAGGWNRAFLDELRMFPNGTNDDQVDALSRAFGELIAPRSSWFS